MRTAAVRHVCTAGALVRPEVRARPARMSRQMSVADVSYHVAVPKTRQQVVAKHPGKLSEVVRTITSPIPELQEGQLLVRMTHLGVNGGHETFTCLATHIGSGNKDRTDFPIGAEGAGVVVATGPGVTAYTPGDSVACASAKFTDYAIIPEMFVEKVPQATAEVVAAALSGMFACLVVDVASDVKPGQTVFVTAGAGAAGSFTVQWARMAGARVIASVGSEAKADAVRAIGGEPINYRSTDVGTALADLCPKGLDWVVDGVGGALQETLIQHMKPGATMLQIGYISEYPHTGAVRAQERQGRPSNEDSFWGGQTVDLGDGKTLQASIWPKDRSKIIACRRKALDKLASGELKALVDSREFHGLDSTLEALEYMLTGDAIGKVVVRV